MIYYVCGFLFNIDFSQVVLIRKNRPVWQSGKLNGIGGKVNENESYDIAMSREFKEETGVYINPSLWKSVVYLTTPLYKLQFFYSTGYFDYIKSMTDERIVIKYVKSLDYNQCISNLNWIIPFSIYKERFPQENFYL